MPRAEVSTIGAVAPVVFKVSASARAGESVTLQGRYLGGPQTGRLRLGATALGEGGLVVPNANIQSWTDNKLVFTVPQGTLPGGGYLFVEVGESRSGGLPFSVRQ